MSLVFGLGRGGVGPTPRGLSHPGYLPSFHPGQIPQRVAWPGPVPASLSLDLLESVLCHFGHDEVHKAIRLLLETLGPPPTGLHLQRYGGSHLGVCWPGPVSVSPFSHTMPFCLHFRGIYREILFLTMAALGKDHVKIGEGAGSGPEGLRDLGAWCVWGWTPYLLTCLPPLP